jgi:hexulose-6-phosphate isomerase
LALIAEEHRITLALENVWNKFLLSPLEFKKYLQEINSPFVKAYFDVGNILIYGVPQHWIRTLGPLIHRIHVKDFRKSDRQFLHLLHGEVQWQEVIKALREIGYDSYLTAELAPYPQLPDQMAIDTSHALDRIFAL